MQMPVLNYPNFCQFLQLHQNQCEQHASSHDRQQAADIMSESSCAGDTSVSNSPTLSPSSSPPLPSTEKTPPGKSFTIDAILGLNDAAQRDPLTFHSAFHSRLNMAMPAASYTHHPALKDKCASEGIKKSNGKSKRVRTIFTPEQLERLEAEFERQQYMVGPERLYLAHTLQLSEAQVKVWFQNRRIKWRKQHLEIQQQRLAVLKERDSRPGTDADGDDLSGDSEDSCPTPSNPAHHLHQRTTVLPHDTLVPTTNQCTFLDHQK